VSFKALSLFNDNNFPSGTVIANFRSENNVKNEFGGDFYAGNKSLAAFNSRSACLRAARRWRGCAVDET
jgi:hypothetical protein